MNTPLSTSPVVKANCPPPSSYIKSHKNITFSYNQDCVSFQHGVLGDTDSFLAGNLHLNYQKQHQIKSVYLHLKGVEKTSWYKAQARSKALYTGEQILVDQPFKIWESKDEESSICRLDIPFKVKLPYNLPETITTEIGSVNYTLRATINRKGSLVSPTTQMIEVQCPLKRTITIDNSNGTPYKLRGESRSGLDYTFVLPVNKNFNLGTYVSIPMRIRFLRPGISVERVEISLKTCMDFRCNNPNETRHVKEQAAFLVVPRQEIRYLQPLSHHYEGECVHTINLFLPRSVQPTYSGRFISVTHQLCIKFCLWGADMDFQVEESVRVANICATEPSIVPPVPLPPRLLSPLPYNDGASSSQYTSNTSIYDPDEISIDVRDNTKNDNNERYLYTKNDNNERYLYTKNDNNERYLYSDQNTEMMPPQHQQQTLNSNVRRQTSPMGELPPPFIYHTEGYAKKFSLNNNRHQYNRDSLVSSVISNNVEEEQYYNLWLYKQKVELALLHQQQQLYQQRNVYNNFQYNHSRSSTPSTSSSNLSLLSLSPTVAPKSPPQPPPTPIPPISTFNDGMPSPNPSPNSKLPPYAAERRPSPNNNNEKTSIRSPASPPPYRGHPQRHYVEAYTYNFDI